MAEITFTPLSEGLRLTAASLNDPLGNIRNGINDLPEDSPAVGAFNENHLPSLVIAQDSERVGTSTLTHTYTSGSYTVITRAGNDLEVDLGSDISIGDGTGVGGILVFLEVFVRKLSGASSGLSNTRGKAFTRISCKPAVGVWSPINRTERYIQGLYNNTGTVASFDGTPQRLIMSTQTLITSSDASVVRKIKGEVKVAPSAGGEAQTLLLRECYLSVIVLRSKKT